MSNQLVERKTKDRRRRGKGYAVPGNGLELKFVERKTRSARQKADDFRMLPTEELLKKYPKDQSVQDAVTVRSLAKKYAEKDFSNQPDKNLFLEKTNHRLFYNLEFGKSIQSPKLKDIRIQAQKPLTQER